jgi:hypothetical protein
VGTNYQLNRDEEERLAALWSRTGAEWNSSEIVAALHLYEGLRGLEISTKIGSPVEQLSRVVCRVNSGIYNKLMNFRALDPRAPQSGLDAGSKLDKIVWAEFFDELSGQMRFDILEAEYARLWQNVQQTEVTLAEAEVIEALSKKDLSELKAQYMAKQPVSRPPRRSVSSLVFLRDSLVVVLRKKLSNGHCEVPNCMNHHFETDAGENFVEIHHIQPLSEGGPDRIENTVALCPNHHRHIHHGKGRHDLVETLRNLRSRDSGEFLQI